MKYTILNVSLGGGNKYKLDTVVEILNNIVRDTPIDFGVRDGVYKGNPVKTLVIAYDMVVNTEQIKRMCLHLNQEAIAVWWESPNSAYGDLIYNPFLDVVTEPFNKDLFIFNFGHQEPDDSVSKGLTFQAVYNFGDKVQDKFLNLQGLCYGDDSHEAFDVHHDNLWYQIFGLGESLFEFQDVFGAGEAISQSELEGWMKEFNEANELAISLEKYLEFLKGIDTDFNWIYC